MSQHLCTSLDVSPSGAGPSAWAGAAAFPLVFWRSQGAFNQSHVASYSIRCQSNTKVQRDLYQIPSYIDILNILRPVDPSKSLQVSPKPPQRVGFASFLVFRTSPTPRCSAPRWRRWASTVQKHCSAAKSYVARYNNATRTCDAFDAFTVPVVYCGLWWFHGGKNWMWTRWFF